MGQTLKAPNGPAKLVLQGIGNLLARNMHPTLGFILVQSPDQGGNLGGSLCCMQLASIFCHRTHVGADGFGTDLSDIFVARKML